LRLFQHRGLVTPDIPNWQHAVLFSADGGLVVALHEVASSSHPPCRLVVVDPPAFALPADGARSGRLIGSIRPNLDLLSRRGME
jgi:hypothetical protein